MTMPPPLRPDGVRTLDRVDRAVLPRDRRSARDARHWLHAWLAPRAMPAILDDALLVISELATNAVRHGRGEMVVRARIGADGALRLSVTDEGAELPALQPADPGRAGGVGLRIVDELSATWGVSPFPGAKTVWASLAPR